MSPLTLFYIGFDALFLRRFCCREVTDSRQKPNLGLAFLCREADIALSQPGSWL
jgi:hypothetical protein